MTTNKLITVFIISILGSAVPSVSFQPPVTTPILSSQQRRQQSSSSSSWQTHHPASTTTSLKLSPSDLFLEPSFIAGGVLWGLNLYYGFDWILAPLGTGWDSDFNPAYRTATFLGNVLAVKNPLEAAKAGFIVDDEGDRPEMGSRIGSGANVGYAVAVENNEVDGADWLSDREAGLRSSAPLPIQIAVAVIYGIFGLLAMAATDSLQTAAVCTIPALVYEIGRPSLPTREEAIFDKKLDDAVAQFARENMLMYGQEILPEGVGPVRRDEATNERELVKVFRNKLQRSGSSLQNEDVADFAIEMKFRELGTGRSEAGYIKGVRLLREPVAWQ